jgi:hypothetical protein
MRATAFHEAGHAAAALLCGEGIYNIHIGVPETGFRIEDSRGRVRNDIWGLAETTLSSEPPELIRAKLSAIPQMRGPIIANVFNNVFVDGAGPAAEAKHVHTSVAAVLLSGTASDDWEHSLESVEALGYTAHEARKMVGEVWSATGRLVTGKRAWSAVTALAEAALSGRAGDDLDDIGLAHLPHAPVRPFGTPIYLPKALRSVWEQQQAEWLAFNRDLEAAGPTSFVIEVARP